MPLPASPPISLQAIQAEMGAPAGTSLAALVRGGAYTPNTPANAGVPTAPPIDLLDFLGASGARVVLTAQSFLSQQVVPPSAVAVRSYRIAADGFVKTASNTGGYSNVEQWMLAGANTDYQVRATSTAGTAWGGALLGTWLDTTADNTWSISRSGSSANAGITEGTCLVEIRNKISGVVLASASIQLRALLTT